VQQKKGTLLKAWYYGRLYKLNLFTDKELKMMESWKKLSLKKLKEKEKECKDAIFSLNFPPDSSRSFPSCRPSFSEINKEDQRLNHALNKIRKLINNKTDTAKLYSEDIERLKEGIREYLQDLPVSHKQKTTALKEVTNDFIDTLPHGWKKNND
tara:strand:+ start:226 stop:687 length:462 start_codon:yes stop_codon:yes gene_type:complete